MNFDYTQKNPLRNYLEIKLNSKHAMFDTNIKAIRFYNFKCKDLKELQKAIWLHDEVEEINSKFVINIELSHLNGEFPEITIQFDTAEVIR